MALVCGIDEAGRGPIIGPMVMCGVLTDEEGAAGLKRIGAKDSKLLSPKQREQLFPKIVKIVKAYKLLIIGPAEIDASVQSDGGMNLNWLEAHKSAEIIDALRPEKIIIDCPSNNVEEYKNYLLQLLKNRKVEAVVEHKADVNHVECSAASILAKVTRDSEVERIKRAVVEDFGSGYLSDPKTVEFFDKYFEVYPDIFRKSWAPYRKKLDGKRQKRLGEFEE
ncbi:ribonuclease HII [Candidatus Woesearchaeota archaeon]|nr:ribonuclease HII [Candidatus Woesearchaeota archaeon]